MYLETVLKGNFHSANKKNSQSSFYKMQWDISFFLKISLAINCLLVIKYEMS